MHFLTPDVGWASEDNPSRLLMSTDGGVRWRDVSPPMLLRKGFALAGGLAGSSFLGPSDFWVSLYDSGPDELLPIFLFHTTDGGREWVRDGSFPNGVGEDWAGFVNDRQGWVAVSNGAAAGTSAVTVYETKDGGRSWSVVSRSMSLTGKPGTPGNPGNCDDTGLSISGSSSAPVLWLSGASNLAPCLAYSTDEGRRWTTSGSPFAASVPKGWGGEAWPPVFSSDPKGWGGEAWPPVFSSAASGALVAWYGTRHGSVTAFYSTSNGGDSWVEHRLALSEPGPVDVVSPTTWAMAAAKSLYFTTNAGVTWSEVPTALHFSGPSLPGALDFVNLKDGWAILGSGQLWHTSSRGRTWALEALPG